MKSRIVTSPRHGRRAVVARRRRFLPLALLRERGGLGVVRALGVSNYEVHHLEELAAYATVQPAVNQIEFHGIFLATAPRWQS